MRNATPISEDVLAVCRAMLDDQPYPRKDHDRIEGRWHVCDFCPSTSLVRKEFQHGPSCPCRAAARLLELGARRDATEQRFPRPDWLDGGEQL